jgi:hypothetical protein
VPEGTTVLTGTVTGDARSHVVAVVLFGPDNVLREAARAAPDSNGRFRFQGIEPGRYRLVPDGGGKKAVVSEPRFLTIEVAPGAVVEAPELRIVRAL